MPVRGKPATLHRNEAILAGHVRYVAPTCPECGKNERYVKTGACVGCQGKKTAQWSAENRERHKEMQRLWAIANKDRIAERKKNEDPVKKAERRRRWAEANPEKVAASIKRSTEAAAPYVRFNLAKRRAHLHASKSGYPQSVKGLTKEEKDLMLSRMSDGCAYCGSNEKMTIDHMTPISKGGQHVISNLQWLCRHHNAQKHARTHDEYLEWCHLVGIILPRLEGQGSFKF